MDQQQAVLGRVMIRCPAAGQSFEVGEPMTRAAFDGDEQLSGTVRCPACADDHAWAKSDAWLQIDAAD